MSEWELMPGQKRARIDGMNKSAIEKLAALLALLPVAAAAPQTVQPSQDKPFVDVTATSNIAYKVGYTAPSLSGRYAWQLSTVTNGGAAAGDCDNDGDIDLFITYGNTSGPDGGGGPNRLYLNQLIEQGQGFSFVDVADDAGVANTRTDGKGNDRHSGPTFADMDGDGDLDLFVGGIFNDPSKIYENQGNCRFNDVTANSPEVEQMLAAHTVSAAFGDYDLDGDLDMFLSHWGTLDETYGYPRERETDHLWRNESDETGIRYVNVSSETGISDLTFLTRLETFCGETVCGDDGVVQVADFTLTPRLLHASTTIRGLISRSPPITAPRSSRSTSGTALSAVSTIPCCSTRSTAWARRWPTSTTTATSIGS